MPETARLSAMFGLSRRQETVAGIVQLFKEHYPQVAAAAISATQSGAENSGQIPLVILLRKEMVDPESFCAEIQLCLQRMTESSFSLTLLGPDSMPEDAGLLQSGHLILDRDPRFRADYTWTAAKGFPGSLTSGKRALDKAA